MQTYIATLNSEETTLFLCTNKRELSNSLTGLQVACAQTISYEDFKKLKLSCLQEFGTSVKLVATKCQGVCPKKAFYGTLIQPTRTTRHVFESPLEVQTMLREELQNKTR